MKRLFKKILDALVFVFLLPISATGCHLQAELNHPDFASGRLLYGMRVAQSGDFIYYDIDGEEGYAVGLTDAAKAKTTIETIPDEYDDHEIVGIWHDGFYMARATSVTLPSTLKTIDYEAFLGSSITSITIPNSVEEIGDGAFYSCSSLTRVQFGENDGEGGPDDCACTVISESSETPKIEKIPSFCFFRCINLRELLLPSGLLEIGEEAFHGCQSIVSSIYLNSIKTIRSRAFQGCKGLNKVYVGNSMFAEDNRGSSAPGIEPHAFNYCSDSLDFTFYATTANYNAWLTNHPDWGLHSDTSPVAYTATVEDGSTYSTTLWQFTVDSHNEVTITNYLGPTPEYFLAIPSSMPLAPAGNKVTRVLPTAFNSTVKNALQRLYLPTTLRAIENNMFSDAAYTKLTVIASTTNCAEDKDFMVTAGKDDSYFDENGRIDLSNITNLQFIGNSSFYGLPKRDKIKKLHLPARLIAVGNSAFSNSNDNRLKNVTEFLWDYIDPDKALEQGRTPEERTGSCLEIVGANAFLGLGESAGSKNYTFPATAAWNGSRTLSTLVFPRTFMHFALTPNDKQRYIDDYGFEFSTTFENNEDYRPARALAGCPLIKKVIFKGSSESSKTTDLVLTAQTFAANHNLQTIIFEERYSKTITFHTNYQNWNGEACIGTTSSTAEKVDFRSSPMLQTLILPCKDTRLRLQRFAFGGNARAVLYLSGSMTSDKANFVPNAQSGTNKGAGDPVNQIDQGFTDTTDLNKNASQWNYIGSETSNGKKRGYDFVGATTGDGQNKFAIEQKLPIYENIHYSESYTDNAGRSVTIEVGSDNTNELYLDYSGSKCAFVCSSGSATMANYLYDCHSGEASTATVPSSVTVNETKYNVTKIGKSAFSACYNDQKDGYAGADLTKVILPNTITTIEEYAFIRAYGVSEVSTSSTNNTYLMPTSLGSIGRHAFAFCGIVKIRQIPYNCVFFENTSSNYLMTSCFSNSLHLRRISFLNNANPAAEGNASRFYTATTYTSTSGSETRTSALYSTNSTNANGFSRKKDRLMLVLNRDPADFDVESPDFTLINDGDAYKSFNGNYKANPCVYGAFKMGYWTKSLSVGTLTKDNETSGSIYAQPLFSAICKRTDDAGALTDNLIYLGFAMDPLYDSTSTEVVCSLREVSGSIYTASKYAFSGCEQLRVVTLDNTDDGVIPDGVFANSTKTDLKFKTTNTTKGRDVNNHVLDLTGTDITKIGKETFRNNQSIQEFIAPDREDFTVDDSAFRDCGVLTTIDFSNVTGTLKLSTCAFANCPNLTTIKWPTHPEAIVDLGSDGIFCRCTGLTEILLPKKTTGVLGNSNQSATSNAIAINDDSYTGVFQQCTSLTHVGVVDDADSDIEFFRLGSFRNCIALDTFDFDKFVSLTTLPRDMFGGGWDSGVNGAAQNADFVFPASITNLEKSTFSGTGLHSIELQSASLTINHNGGKNNLFARNRNLVTVKFASNCALDSSFYQITDMFNGCTVLEYLILPAGFLMQSPGSMVRFIQDAPNVNIMIQKKPKAITETENTNINAGSGKWRRTSENNNQTAKDVTFYVDALADVLKDDYSGLYLTNTPYWTYISGNPVILGKSKTYDSANQKVTFDNENYYLDSNGFHAAS